MSKDHGSCYTLQPVLSAGYRWDSMLSWRDLLFTEDCENLYQQSYTILPFLDDADVTPVKGLVHYLSLELNLDT